tara:strand:- start:16 stop:435 length:420 start_codon:yes stop_codon:yes gene_type:complete
MIIITKEIIDAKKEIPHDIVADSHNIKKFKKDMSLIKKNTPIKIYDLGFIKKESQKIIKVKDHLNKTGINPIIGSDEIDFKDIGCLYKNKTGIITTCCGKDLNLNHKNPSHFLCIFSVLVFYLGFTNISGFIININYEK